MTPTPGRSRHQRTRVAAYGLITRDDQILLCRISDQLPQHHGKWTLPGGGIEFGETPEEAALREIEEETGLAVSIDRLLLIDSVVVDTPNADIHSFRILYSAIPKGGRLRNEIDGTTDLCQWWPFADLPDMVDVAMTGVSIVSR